VEGETVRAALAAAALALAAAAVAAALTAGPAAVTAMHYFGGAGGTFYHG